MEEKELENKVEEKSQEVTSEKTFNYDHDALKQIEETRAKFYKGYRISSIFKWPIAFLSIGVLVIAFFGMSFWGFPLALAVVLAAISLVFMATYTLVSKFVLNKKSKKYFANFYEQVTKYVFDDESLKEVDCEAARKIDRIEFDENLLYSNIDNVGSRALTFFKYKELALSVCDLAAQIRIDRRPKPVFVGKYVVAPSKYDINDPIFIYIKGDSKRSLPPTGLEEYKIAFDDEKMTVYSNNGKWNKFFVNKIKNAFLNLKKGDFLVDISISLRPGKAYICLGYDDPLMVLPLDKPFDPEPTKEYKEELKALLTIIEELNK